MCIHPFFLLQGKPFCGFAAIFRFSEVIFFFGGVCGAFDWGLLIPGFLAAAARAGTAQEVDDALNPGDIYGIAGGVGFVALVVLAGGIAAG